MTETPASDPGPVVIRARVTLTYDDGTPRLAPHPWDEFARKRANWLLLHPEPEPEPEHETFDGYCPQCGGCCLVGFGNP